LDQKVGYTRSELINRQLDLWKMEIQVLKYWTVWVDESFGRWHRLDQHPKEDNSQEVVLRKAIRMEASQWRRNAKFSNYKNKREKALCEESKIRKPRRRKKRGFYKEPKIKVLEYERYKE
jgi:hypothetical protein